MKHAKSVLGQKQKPAGALPLAVVEESGQGKIGFMPSPDEVSRKAYLCYVNEGSVPGHDVRHWLVAEAELIAENNLNPSSPPNQRDANSAQSGEVQTNHGTSQVEKPLDAQTLFRSCALL